MLGIEIALFDFPPNPKMCVKYNRSAAIFELELSDYKTGR